jgi:hypothetical protein
MGRPDRLTGFEWLWAYFTHTAHPRAQAEVKPPDCTFLIALSIISFIFNRLDFDRTGGKGASAGLG